MLSAPRDIRQAQWGYQSKGGLASAASSPGEDLPPVPMTLPYDPIREDSGERRVSAGDKPGGQAQQVWGAQPSAGPSGFRPSGGETMTRMGSANAQIGGVEWIDWMDEYKRYKEAKIQADNQAAKLKAQAEMPPPPLPGQSVTSDSPRNSPSARSSPLARDTARISPRETLPSTMNDNSSAIDLTPSASRDGTETHSQGRRRSMSIRSQLSSLDPTRSPGQRKLSVFERPRQTSNSSNRSEAASSSAGVKKKKNLVNKMEGWWNAVKSNFNPETNSPHQAHRPSNLGVYAERRVPSAPASRRTSGKSVAGEPEPPAPAMLRRDTSHSLRNATSVAELRSPLTATGPPMLADAANIVASTSGDILTLPRAASMLAVPSGMSAFSTSSPSRGAPDTLPVPKSGLDGRRRQPGLRLELEPHVLVQPVARSRGHSSNGSISALPSHLSTVASSASGSHRPSENTSRSSSYGNGNTSAGPGLTPGVQPWEQTPSPIFALNTANSGDGKPGAENTVASVRRHVKHRLNGAKETCDNTLHKVIAAITLFADETRAQDEALVDEKRRLEEQRDYFENISDSPIIDDQESDAEGSLALDGSRSRNGKSHHLQSADASVSTSRGPSRRPSISRPSVASSPTRRASILPGSPNRPTRRRPSAQPRNYVGRDRLNRSTGLALDRTRSGTSSRSTSRSHSPMPMFAKTLPSTADIEDDVEADRQFLASLQELIVIATDVLESSVNSFLTKPSACTEIIQKLQRVGQNWDEHDDWPGRSWYVEILMAIAGLRRVLDWWEAEKGFWAFDDEDENEPLLFVLKPKEESKFDQEFKAHYDRSISPIRPILARDPSNQDTQEPRSSEIEPSLSTGRTAHPETADIPIAKGVDELKFLAEHAKMVNIVMELSLQGEEIQYVNDAIMEVTGQDPDGVLGQPINELLAPADANTFAEATQKLLEDDNNTVQMRVRIEVADLDNDTKGEHQPGPVYVEVEGVGMLMRENNEPSHTMWVLKPVAATQRDAESTAPPDAAFPVERIMSNESLLCRICERDIVSWFFEKHNETCDAVHRLEAEVSDCNECLRDLCHTFVKLKGEVDSQQGTDQPNHKGVLFYEIPECLADNSAVPPGTQGVEIRKINSAQLESVIEVLKAAEHIETPIVREDEADLEFNVQRYLGRESEEHLITVSRWQRPSDIDRSLVMLYNHVEAQMRRKQKAIARMQSTIRYSEKTRHEWEDKVNRLLEELEDNDQSGSASGSGTDEPETTPPLADAATAPDNSPPNTTRKIAPQARIPITQGHPQRPSTAHGSSPFGQSQFAKKSSRPTTSHGSTLVTRPKPDSAPPSAALIVPTRPDQLKRSRSSHSGPNSPLMVPADRTSHARRVSTSRALMSAPLSPRIPSAASQPRAAPPSIKDFEIIKPISRGAFGSVYLAKKVATGDYFAIKALKKSDMIAKNQITNVKAERTILMNQSSSPYVTKLFFSFQSKDYLYLVMEYLNGGDCASLVKTLGGLPEEWARNYIAEVVLGLEYLHARNIVHR
jgi:serine/threonine-protein kinase RIM15